MSTPQQLADRITAYLISGGLFNPELAIHDNVRDLLIECREALSSAHPSKPLPEASQPQECPYWAVRHPSGGILQFTLRYETGDTIDLFEAQCGSWPNAVSLGYSLVRVAIVEEPKT